MRPRGTVYYICDDIFDFTPISGVFFIVIFILSLIGNIFIACVLLLYEKLNKVTNLFVLNVVFADLVFTITLPFWSVYDLHHWVFGELMCKFVTAFYITGQYTSIILLTAMTVDRFITVVLNWPQQPVRRLRCAQVSCAVAWLIGTVASVSDAVKMKVKSYDDFHLCEDTSEASSIRLGYYLQLSLLFFLPFAVMVFCYSAILKTVLQASNRKQHRTVVMVLCIVAAFFICWAPYNISLLVSSFIEVKSKNCYFQERFQIANSVCQLLAFSHCCMNPLLYMFSQKLRKHVLEVLRCEKAWGEKREGITAQSTFANPNAAYNAAGSAVTFDLPSG